MQQPSDEEIKAALENVKAERDRKRPPMELVVSVFDRLFDRFAETADFRRVLRGPDTWSWMDATNADLGFEKWFVLSRSAMEGTEGYPLVTIRLSTAPRLDSYLTFSQLVVGTGEREIEYSLAMAIANHMGAFEGLRDQIDELLLSFSGIAPDQLSRVADELHGTGKKDVN